MSEISTLPEATEALSTSKTAEATKTEVALVAAINEGISCGQTSIVFSSKLTDEQIELLRSKKFDVKITGVDKVKTPQYIISLNGTIEEL